MSEIVTGCNFVFLSHFQTLIREVEEKEVSSQQHERDASRCTVLCDVAFTRIYHLLFEIIARYIYELADHTRHCFSASAAAHKTGLDGAGTPRDVRKFGKGAL